MVLHDQQKDYLFTHFPSVATLRGCLATAHAW